MLSQTALVQTLAPCSLDLWPCSSSFTPLGFSFPIKRDDNSYLPHEEQWELNGSMPANCLEWNLVQRCLLEAFDMPNTVIFSFVFWPEIFTLFLYSLNFIHSPLRNFVFFGSEKHVLVIFIFKASINSPACRKGSLNVTEWMHGWNAFGVLSALLVLKSPLIFLRYSYVTPEGQITFFYYACDSICRGTPFGDL